MTIDRIVFVVAMLVGLPSLAYSVGIERGQVAAAKTCPPVQQEKLVLSEQRPGSTICHYAAEPRGHGMARTKRKAS